MAEGLTCYERDETFCEDQMCLRTGCRIRNERLASAVTPGREELLALAARLVVASDILRRKPCEVVYLQQDCLAAAEAIRLAAKPSDDPDAMNERRVAEDARLAANVREAAAKLLEVRADGFSGRLAAAIFSGKLMAEELRLNADKIRALSTAGEPKT